MIRDRRLNVRNLLRSLPVLVALAICASPCLAKQEQLNPGPAKIFRLHLVTEPSSLSPLVQRSSGSLHFLSQISAPLLTLYQGELSPFAGECRQTSGKTVRCLIRDIHWSDGRPLRPADFIRSFRALVDPRTAAPRADLLFPVKNAREILAGKKKPETLGVRAEKNELIFSLEQEDMEFLFHLSSPILSPLRGSDPTAQAIKTNQKGSQPPRGKTNPKTSSAGQAQEHAAELRLPLREIPPPERASREHLSAGPYQVSEWIPNRRILLSPNPGFPGHEQRPQLEFQFLADDTLAQTLFERGELDFLRRLPTAAFSKWRNRPETHNIDQFRFDYIGFSPELRRHSSLVEALAQAIPFIDLQKLWSAKPTPGCPGLPASVLPSPDCITFNPAAAKLLISRLQVAHKEANDVLPNLSLKFSRAGGDDHSRSMEFLQAKWREILGLKVGLEQVDHKLFLQELEDPKAWKIARKGLAPDRPTCRAVLEAFLPGSTEAFLQAGTPELEKIVTEMKKTKSANRLQEFCKQGLASLIKKPLVLVPTGPIYFTVLAKTNWKGWRLNEFNQLDLSQLHPAK